jgi:hypothetical protein
VLGSRESESRRALRPDADYLANPRAVVARNESGRLSDLSETHEFRVLLFVQTGYLTHWDQCWLARPGSRDFTESALDQRGHGGILGAVTRETWRS